MDVIFLVHSRPLSTGQFFSHPPRSHRLLISSGLCQALLMLH